MGRGRNRAPSSQPLEAATTMSSQASTIAFPQRRQFVEGLPPEIAKDETTLDVTALAIANLAGESWTEMSPTRCEEFRAWAMLAAVASHPEGLRLLGYALGRATDSRFSAPSAEGRLLRLNTVDRMMAALRGASLRVAGIGHGPTHRELLDVMRQDAQPAAYAKTYSLTVEVRAGDRFEISVCQFVTTLDETDATEMVRFRVSSWPAALDQIGSYIDRYQALTVFIYHSGR